MKRPLCALSIILGTGAIIAASCNTIARVKISQPEKEFYKRLEKDCNCKVAYHHDYKLIKGITTTDSSGFSLDLTQYRNYKGVQYDKSNDWCYKDSMFLVNKSGMIIKEFLSVSGYAGYYKKITLYFTTYRNVGVQEILTNEMCAKKVIYYLDKEQTTLETRLMQ